jgi:predicted Zn-dependent peptidase
MSTLVHRRLDCGIEFGGQVLPDRQTLAIDLRTFGGMAYEKPDYLGLAHVVVETIDKGTAKRTGRELSDAFDALGIRHGSWAGRECIGFAAQCLPEFLDPTIELFGEMLRTPTFPDDAVEVALDLARQELDMLEDEPRELTDKILTRQSYGDPLGRHALGELETIERITRDAVVGHWTETFAAGRMQVSVAGNFDPDHLVEKLETTFEGFQASAPDGRSAFPLGFQPIRTHRDKDIEQEHIGICYPGVPADAADYPVQRVLLAILAGGMSSRLFTELREKQALVYWVNAWAEYPRGHGMIHLGASTKPERCDKTYRALLGEIDRLGVTLEEPELARAITGIVSRTETRGDITRARCQEVAGDLFLRGRLIPTEEKLDKIRVVTIDDIRRFLADHPRDQLSIVTLGPRELEAQRTQSESNS